MPTLKRLLYILLLIALLFYGISFLLINAVKPTIVEIKKDIPLNFIEGNGNPILININQKAK